VRGGIAGAVSGPSGINDESGEEGGCPFS